MGAHFYTKQLQGSMFNKFRLLNLNDNYNHGVSLSTKKRQDPKSVLSKQVRKADKKYPGTDINRITTARGLELSKVREIKDYCRFTINNLIK